MNPIETWILGQVIKGSTQRAIAALFKETLLTRLRSTAELWRSQLTENERLDAMEALLKKVAPGLDLPPAPLQVFAKLEAYQLPDAEDWTAALIRQWEWVRTTIEDPQPFFLLPEDQAQAKLAELGRLLAIECQKDRELFQIACLKVQQEHGKELSEISEKLDRERRDRNEFGAELMATIQHLPARIGAVTEVTGGFHGEIDAAVAFTQQGQPDVALAQLEILRRQRWDKLSERERFRVVANIGHAYNAKEQFAQAARQFIVCQTFQSEDEQARCLAAIGHSMLGDSTQAFQLAEAICSDFPNPDLGRATWVRNAPRNRPFATVEASVPAQLRAAVETASALCWRSLQEGDVASAERYARTALMEDKNSRPLLEQLALVLFELVRKDAAAQHAESPRLCNPEKAAEAEHLLMQVLRDTPTGLPAARARTRFHLGIVAQLQGKWDEAFTHLQVAYDSDDSNPQFARQFAMMLCDREEESQAISVLRNIKENHNTHENVILLAHLLAGRNGSGDHDEATTMLQEQTAHLAEIEPWGRSELIVTLVGLLCRMGRVAEAEETMQRLPPGLLAPEVLHAIQAYRLRHSGNIDLAKHEALAAVTLLGPETDRHEHRRIATELTALGLVEKALPIWKQLVEPRYLGVDTPTLLHCAVKCGDVKFLTKFCAELRKNGVIDRDAIHLEINLLQEYHCFNRAADLMGGYLQTAPETTLTREIRARLSHMAIITGRDELVEFDPQRLPRIDEVDPELGLAVVEVLSHGPEPLNGVRFAYDLLRRHFESYIAHKAMVASFLFGRREDLTLPESEVAGPGMAVRYREDDSGDYRWHVIEDGIDPDPARNEYSPEHGVSKILDGKIVGDQFYLRKDSIQERTATIVEVWSKYKLRFNRCMEEWENRFPENYFLWKFSVKKNAEDKSDFDAIFKSVDQRIAQTREREELYRNNPLSVTNFSVMTGTSVLDAVQHIGGRPELPVRCCGGTDIEFAAANSALATGMPLLLDGSALATLFVARAHIHLQDLGIQLVVSEGTLQEWRRRYIEKLNSPREGGFLTKEGAQFVLINESEEEIELRLGEFRCFLETICLVAQVEEGLPLCELTRDTREGLIEILGRPAAESIAIARSKFDFCTLGGECDRVFQ